jgi:hypothetical protein
LTNKLIQSNGWYSYNLVILMAGGGSEDQMFCEEIFTRRIGLAPTTVLVVWNYDLCYSKESKKHK